MLFPLRVAKTVQAIGVLLRQDGVRSMNTRRPGQEARDIQKTCGRKWLTALCKGPVTCKPLAVIPRAGTERTVGASRGQS